MNRHHVFLDAMGLGPQWRLRHAPAVMEGDGAMADTVVDAVTDAAGDAAGAQAAGYPDDAVAHAAHAAPAGQAGAPAASDNVAGAAGTANHAPAAHAAVATGAPPGGAGQLPAASAAAPAAPRAAPSSGEDTSWFDDAPAAPSTRPALKSPPPAKAPPPARPAAQGAANPAAGAGGASGRDSGGDSGGESYAWFDDVPATPIAKPVRKAGPEADAEDEAPWRDAAPARPAARPGPQARPTQPAYPAHPAQRASSQSVPDDGMPWFDDAPLPSFDAGFDDLYGGEESESGSNAGVSDAAIARMDRAALQAAVQSCTRCALCRERGAAVPGRGADSAPWLVLATAPNGDDEAQGRPLAGAPGQLLDNMLKAIGVAPEAQAYVTTLVKCRPQGDRAPAPEELAACRPYLERELALAGSRAVITLGHTAGKGLLGAAARGKVLRLGQVPVVATYHPADLLRKSEDKARAWADLCLARSAFDGRA
jgi:DNA polymerase